MISKGVSQQVLYCSELLTMKQKQATMGTMMVHITVPTLTYFRSLKPLSFTISVYMVCVCVCTLECHTL